MISCADLTICLQDVMFYKQAQTFVEKMTSFYIFFITKRIQYIEF